MKIPQKKTFQILGGWRLELAMLLPPSTLSQAEPAKLWAAAAHKSSGTRCGSGQLS